MSDKTNKEKGILNSEKLRRYIEKTPLDDIPRNQFKTASQQKILKSLGIATSNRNAPQIAELFEELDKMFGTTPPQIIKGGNSEEVKSLKQTISKLQNRIAALKGENEELKAEQLGEEWFIETGRLVRFK